jgi:hypothetical protein
MMDYGFDEGTVVVVVGGGGCSVVLFVHKSHWWSRWLSSH